MIAAVPNFYIFPFLGATGKESNMLLVEFLGESSDVNGIFTGDKRSVVLKAGFFRFSSLFTVDIGSDYFLSSGIDSYGFIFAFISPAWDYVNYTDSFGVSLPTENATFFVGNSGDELSLKLLGDSSSFITSSDTFS